jgi:hypothetical protein
MDAVVVNAAADEMTSSNAKVLVADVRHVRSAQVTDVTFAKTSNVIPAKVTDVGSTKAIHVTSTKATHMAPAEAAHVSSATTTVSSTTTAAAAGLCTRGNKAAGKQCARQNHHCSSSHNTLHLDGRTFRRRALSDVGVSQQSKRQRRDGLEMGMAILLLY